MKKIILILISFVIAFLNTNCTIQKRTLKRGYFVQWYFSNYKMGNATCDKEVETSNTVSFSNLNEDAKINVVIEEKDFNKSVISATKEIIENEESHVKIQDFQKSDLHTGKIINEWKNANLNRLFETTHTDETILKKDKLPAKIERNQKRRTQMFLFLKLALLSMGLVFICIILVLIFPIDILNIMYFVFLGILALSVLLSIVFYTLSFFPAKEVKT